MKYLLFCVSILMLLGSCGDEQEAVYSCNPQIDQWVKDNIDDIQKMTRADLVKFDRATQRGVYGAFTANQKREAWRDKINEVIALDLSAEEKAHVGESMTFINANDFIFSSTELTATDEQIETLSLFIYRWTELATENFGWSMESCGAVVADLGTTKTARLTRGGPTVIITDPEPDTNSASAVEYGDCDCNLSSIWYADCVNVGSKCNHKDTGCGTFTWHACNGMHEPGIMKPKPPTEIITPGEIMF